ncbi:hypothetical protein KNE206_30840 [Kitasatospora sp. NE20-6]|uniref:chaplin n=1 Tax=Kitasatospora sp. NE20-6 TaxID=2859066 RepID=UPI0034DBA881
MSRLTRGSAAALLAGAALLGSAQLAAANAEAEGIAAGSPGVLSGNLIQIPVHVPVNACGNSINVIGALNPAFGNSCANISLDDDQDEEYDAPHESGHGHHM